MVARANQVYLRSDKRAGELTLNWGDAPASSARCITAYLPDGLDSTAQRPVPLAH